MSLVAVYTVFILAGCKSSPGITAAYKGIKKKPGERVPGSAFLYFHNIIMLFYFPGKIPGTHPSALAGFIVFFRNITVVHQIIKSFVFCAPGGSGRIFTGTNVNGHIIFNAVYCQFPIISSTVIVSCFLEYKKFAYYFTPILKAP